MPDDETLSTYLLIMDGVYRHEIRGVFPSLEAGAEIVPELVHLCAMQVMKCEPDDYHDLLVLQCTPNLLIDDAREVARYRREDEELSLVRDKEGELVPVWEMDRAQRLPVMESFSALKVTIVRDVPPFCASWLTDIKPSGRIELHEAYLPVRESQDAKR